jgi:N-methylhydantoinase B
MGLRRDVRVLGHTCNFSAQGERFVLQPWGLFGGKPGGTGRLVLHPGTKRETILHSKISKVEIAPDEVVSIQTPGAGGYGNPKGRNPESIQKDFREGKISREKTRQDYGIEVV